MSLLAMGLGLVGSAITNITSVFTLRETNKLKLKMIEVEMKRMEHDEKIIVLQSQGDVALAEIENRLEVLRTSREGLAKSIDDQTAIIKNLKQGGKVATIMAMFRPFVTTGLVLFTVHIAFAHLGAMVELDNSTMAGMAAAALIELTSLSVSWWFGDRSLKRGVENVVKAGQVRAAGGAF